MLDAKEESTYPSSSDVQLMKGCLQVTVDLQLQQSLNIIPQQN